MQKKEKIIKPIIIMVLIALLSLTASSNSYNWVRPNNNQQIDLSIFNNSIVYTDTILFWAEENDVIDNAQYEYSFGNGAVGGGIAVTPNKNGTLSFISLLCTTGTGTAVVEVRVNQASVGCNVTSTGLYASNSCDVPVLADDKLNGYTITDSGHAYCVLTWAVDIKTNISIMGLKGDKGDSGNITVNLTGYIKNFTNASLSGINLTGDIKPVNNRTQSIGNASNVFDAFYFQRFGNSFTPINNKTQSIGNKSNIVNETYTMDIRLGNDLQYLYYPNLTTADSINGNYINITFRSYGEYDSRYPIGFTWWQSTIENVSNPSPNVFCGDGGDGDDITTFTAGESGEFVSSRYGIATINCNALNQNNTDIFLHVVNPTNGRVYNQKVLIRPTPDSIPPEE